MLTQKSIIGAEVKSDMPVAALHQSYYGRQDDAVCPCDPRTLVVPDHQAGSILAHESDTHINTTETEKR